MMVNMEGRRKLSGSSQFDRKWSTASSNDSDSNDTSYGRRKSDNYLEAPMAPRASLSGSRGSRASFSNTTIYENRRMGKRDSWENGKPLTFKLRQQSFSKKSRTTEELEAEYRSYQRTAPVNRALAVFNTIREVKEKLQKSSDMTRKKLYPSSPSLSPSNSRSSAHNKYERKTPSPPRISDNRARIEIGAHGTRFAHRRTSSANAELSRQSSAPNLIGKHRRMTSSPVRVSSPHHPSLSRMNSSSNIRRGHRRISSSPVRYQKHGFPYTNHRSSSSYQRPHSSFNRPGSSYNRRSSSQLFLNSSLSSSVQKIRSSSATRAAAAANSYTPSLRPASRQNISTATAMNGDVSTRRLSYMHILTSPMKRHRRLSSGDSLLKNERIASPTHRRDSSTESSPFKLNFKPKTQTSTFEIGAPQKGGSKLSAINVEQIKVTVSKNDSVDDDDDVPPPPPPYSPPPVELSEMPMLEIEEVDKRVNNVTQPTESESETLKRANSQPRPPSETGKELGVSLAETRERRYSAIQIPTIISSSNTETIKKSSASTLRKTKSQMKTQQIALPNPECSLPEDPSKNKPKVNDSEESRGRSRTKLKVRSPSRDKKSRSLSKTRSKSNSRSPSKQRTGKTTRSKSHTRMRRASVTKTKKPRRSSIPKRSNVNKTSTATSVAKGKKARRSSINKRRNSVTKSVTENKNITTKRRNSTTNPIRSPLASPTTRVRGRSIGLAMASEKKTPQRGVRLARNAAKPPRSPGEPTGGGPAVIDDASSKRKSISLLSSQNSMNFDLEVNRSNNPPTPTGHRRANTPMSIGSFISEDEREDKIDSDSDLFSPHKKILNLITASGRPITPETVRARAVAGSPSNQYERIRQAWGQEKMKKKIVEKPQERKVDAWTAILHSVAADPALKTEIRHMQAMLKSECKSEHKLQNEIKVLLEERGKWLVTGKKKSKVKCVVRARPVPTEMNIASTPNEETLKICTTSKNVDLTDATTSHTFTFDRVYPMEASNEYVYKTCARPLVASIFQKKKVSMFSYGATGSGKTYTMIGVEKDRGIFYRTVRDIYTILKFKENKNLTADLSVFEIYGSGIFDLLNERTKLKARNDRKGNTRIIGLTHQVCKTMSDMLNAADCATEYRKVGSTHANDVSSRSHAIIRIRIINLTKNRVHGKFQIIDLAGSERARDVGAVSRERQREGAEINKSLLALKECIRMMGMNQKKGKKRTQHVSFRSSVLTRLLKSSLMGNTNTIMVACVGATKKAIEPTMNTLRYATQLKNMKPVVSQKINSTEDDDFEEDEVAVKESAIVSELKAIIQEQREMINKEYSLLEAQERLLLDLEKCMDEPDVDLLRELSQTLKQKSILLHSIPKIKQNMSSLQRKII